MFFKKLRLNIQWTDCIKNVLYLTKYMLVVFTFTSLVTLFMMFQKTKYAMVCIQGIFIFLVLVDIIMKTHIVTYSNTIQNEVIGIVSGIVVYIVLSFIGMRLFKKRDLV